MGFFRVAIRHLNRREQRDYFRVARHLPATRRQPVFGPKKEVAWLADRKTAGSLRAYFAVFVMFRSKSLRSFRTTLASRSAISEMRYSAALPSTSAASDVVRW